jgi:hypothetical protein
MTASRQKQALSLSVVRLWRKGIGLSLNNPKGDGSMVEVDIHLKSGNILRIKLDNFSVDEFLKNMSTIPGSVIHFEQYGFVVCSEIAAVLKVE